MALAPGPFAPGGYQPVLDTPSFRQPGEYVGTDDDIELNRRFMDEQLQTILKWIQVNPINGPIAKSESVSNPLAEEIRYLFMQLPDPRVGLPFSDLTKLIEENGAENVGLALKSLGKVTLSAHRVYILNMKSEPMSKAFNTAFKSGSDFASENPATRSREVLVGTKKLWNDRIMEKGHDRKWHMIGRAKKGGGVSSRKDSDKAANNKMGPEHIQLSNQEAADYIRRLIRLHHAAKRISAGPAK